MKYKNVKNSNFGVIAAIIDAIDFAGAVNIGFSRYLNVESFVVLKLKI